MSLFHEILSITGIILQSMGLLVLTCLAWDAITMRIAMRKERKG